MTDAERATLRRMRERLPQGHVAALRRGYVVLSVTRTNTADLVLAWNPSTWEVRAMVVDADSGCVMDDVPEEAVWTGS
jgi:hypothetical protein